MITSASSFCVDFFEELFTQDFALVFILVFCCKCVGLQCVQMCKKGNSFLFYLIDCQWIQCRRKMQSSRKLRFLHVDIESTKHIMLGNSFIKSKCYKSQIITRHNGGHLREFY